MMLSAAFASTNLGAKLIADAKALAKNREAQAGLSSEVDDCIERLQDMNVYDECATSLLLGSILV